MPNTTVPAAAEGMPKFNVSQIMTEAWSIYRRKTAISRPTFAADRRELFAYCLRTAWAWAKERIAEARKTLQQRAAERVEELTRELMRIEARPFGMRIETSRRAVQAEIDSLQAVATH